MKTIKIKYVGFWDEFNYKQCTIQRILEKYFDVRVVEDPDYIICSMFGTPYQYCQYPQVRVFFSGENYTPDFNLLDYAISPYPIQFLDRHYYYPACIDTSGRCMAVQNKDRNYPNSILTEKVFFANFIAGHESEYNIRGDFFKKLCEYKRVESPGTYLNNRDHAEKLSFTDGTKTAFQRKCKFTLCFESTSHNGFVTEKLMDAFLSDTIPVYYGSETVSDIFNTKAFINCLDYPDFDAVIEKIKELDQDDVQYMEMLRQPVFVDPCFPEKAINGLERYLISIFEQPLEKAYRRSRVYKPRAHNDYLLNVSLQDKASRTQEKHKFPQRVLKRVVGERVYDALRKMIRKV